MNLALMDTGPLVAYLDVHDPEHRLVAEVLEQYAGTLCTTGAVVTEAMHLVSGNSHGPSTLAAFFEESQVKIYDCFGYAELKMAVSLMGQYHNLPMDFADATLILLSEQLACTDIFTLDRRGFKTFRTPSKRGFRLMLDA